MAQIALLMNEDAEENILQLENTYFDSTHTRVYGFKTFGLWLTHPAMKQIIQLASMEICSENYVHIAVFFKLFNRMLIEFKGESDMFKPRYFVCDEGGANYKAIREVYGDGFCKEREKGCQWHFKSDVRKHAVKVSEKRRERFKEVCHEMCDVTTVKGFNILLAELKVFAVNFPELKGFVEYWEQRKSHIFSSFMGGGIPGVNLSQPGNVMFKPPVTMHLVKAAIYDVSHMLQQELQIYLFECNLLHCVGRGQSKQSRDAKDHAQQIRAAEEFANIFMNDVEGVLLEAKQGMHPDLYLPKKDCHHRAPKKKVGEKKVSNVRGGKVKTVSFRRGGKQVEVTEEMLRDKCLLVMEVIDDEITPNVKMNKINNPPLIVMATLFIHKCKGCKGRITPEDKAYPHDMVFNAWE